jgi:hypothetical protein
MSDDGFPDNYTEDEKAEYRKEFGEPKHAAIREEKEIIERVREPTIKIKEVLPGYTPASPGDRMRFKDEVEHPSIKDRFKRLTLQAEGRIREKAPEIGKKVGTAAKSGLKNLAHNLKDTAPIRQRAPPSRARARTTQKAATRPRYTQQRPASVQYGSAVIDTPGTMAAARNRAETTRRDMPAFNTDFILGNPTQPKRNGHSQPPAAFNTDFILGGQNNAGFNTGFIFGNGQPPKQHNKKKKHNKGNDGGIHFHFK